MRSSSTDPKLVDGQIKRWNLIYDLMSRDETWMSQHVTIDEMRVEIRQEIEGLIRRYLIGEIDTETFRSTLDSRTRSEWSLFGIKGLSGAMFLNKLVKHVIDREELATQLIRVLQVPSDTADAADRLRAFLAYLNRLIDSGPVTRMQIQPARAPFFISACWHMQQMEEWPIFYESGRQALAFEGIYQPGSDPVEDYMTFRDAFQVLQRELDLTPWGTEHFLIWYAQHRGEVPQTDAMRMIDMPSFHSDSINAREEGTPDSEMKNGPHQTGQESSADDVTKQERVHTRVQGILAEIGAKLGFKIWIASNDRSQLWRDGRLGDLSIDHLPTLGMNSEVQRIIGLIDLLWIKGKNEVVAAFEVECTTSIFSGLLRMADLVALTPNIKFPLYIVAGESRMHQVHKQLSRPSFQALNLHTSCGYLAYEQLIAEAEQIKRWAESPAAIERLAHRVSDVINTEAIGE